MTTRISRRELALAAAGIATAAAQESERSYGGALEGASVDAKAFDPVAWTLQRHDSAPLKLTFKATTRKQAEAWQKQLRAKLVELVGALPAAGGPVRAQTLDVREFATYKREKFVFESRPGVGVLGYLIVPAKAQGRWRR